jgi:mRNA interferase MazF
MNTGTIVLIPFPFAELTNIKVRPALVISTTKDKYQDLILCAISSVLPAKPDIFEMVVQPDRGNNLRVSSVIKIDRLVTLKKEDIITVLGTISAGETEQFKKKFKIVSAQKVWVNSRLYEHSTSGELFFKAFYPDFLSGYLKFKQLVD